MIEQKTLTNGMGLIGKDIGNIIQQRINCNEDEECTSSVMNDQPVVCSQSGLLLTDIRKKIHQRVLDTLTKEFVVSSSYGAMINTETENFAGKGSEMDRKLEILDSFAKSDLKSKRVYTNNIGFFYDGEYLCAGNIKVANFDIEIIEITDVIRKYCSSRDKTKSYVTETIYSVSVTIGSEHLDKTVSAVEFKNVGWIRKIPIAFYYKEGQKMNAYEKLAEIRIKQFEKKHKVLYDSIGWKDVNGKLLYITKSGFIGDYAGHASIISDWSCNYLRDKIKGCELFNWFFRMTKMTPNNPASLLLMLHTFASSVSTLFDMAGTPLKFIMVLKGVSNSKKTSMAVNLTQVWNRKPNMVPTISFRDTLSYITSQMPIYTDSVLLVDDLTPGETAMERSEMQKKLSLIVRSYGDQNGKKVNTSYLKLDNVSDFDYEVKGGCLITSEEISAIHSSLTRMIILEIGLNDVDTECLTYFQENYLILPTVIRSFLEYVTHCSNDIISWLKNYVFAKRTEYKDLFDIPRYSENLAQFEAIITMILNWGKSLNVLNEENTEKLHNQWFEVVKSQLCYNNSRINDKKPARTFAEALMYVIDNNLIPLYRTTCSFDMERSRRIFHDDQYFYIKKEIGFEVLNLYLKANNYFSNILDSKALGENLVDDGIISRKSFEGKLKRPYREKENDNSRYWFVDKQAILSIIQKE